VLAVSRDVTPVMREGRNAHARATPECLKATPLQRTRGYYVTKKLLETNKYIQSAQEHDCLHVQSVVHLAGSHVWSH
jgi:hypothetical protein